MSMTPEQVSKDLRELIDRVIGITHVGGVPYYEAPLPPRLHRCRPWTVNARLDVERCPCGSRRIDRGRWKLRNDRRAPWWTLRGWR